MNYQLGDDSPRIGDDAFIAPSADVIGDVIVGDRSSLWFGVVARGDVDRIQIGSETNIQDNTVLHVRRGMPLTIGDRVTVGHAARLHACKIEDEVLVGIGSVLLDNVIVRSHSMIAAGSVVPPGTEIPPGAVYMGTPASLSRNVTEDEIEVIRDSAKNYVDHAAQYLKDFGHDSN